jgi:hypothetical protein
MKVMPSAVELRELCSIDAFVDAESSNLQRAARYGETSYTIDVPHTMAMPVVKSKIEEVFPGCKIVNRWFTRLIIVSWA